VQNPSHPPMGCVLNLRDMQIKWALPLVGLLMFSCVSKKQYKAALNSKDSLNLDYGLYKVNSQADMDSLRRALRIIDTKMENQRLLVSSLQDSLQICGNELAENQTYIRSLGADLGERQKAMALEIEKKNKTLQDKELELNDALAMAEKERLRLEKLRKELELVSNRVKELESELRRKDSAVLLLKEAIIKALAGFEKLDVKVEYKNGKVYVILPEKLLFKSGSTSVDPSGVEAIVELSKALKKQPDVQISVEGHTDNIPMNSDKIKDNWDLSVLRATSITKIMINEGGLDGKRISANGRGETNPVASNDTPEGRAKNRRTEIILTPQLDKILQILNTN